jgi:hypothetical protein
LAVDIVILNRKADDVMSIVCGLRDQGLIQGVDFDFAYRQATFDPITGHSVTDRHTVFTFYAEKYATLFALKWS